MPLDTNGSLTGPVRGFPFSGLSDTSFWFPDWAQVTPVCNLQQLLLLSSSCLLFLSSSIHLFLCCSMPVSHCYNSQQFCGVEVLIYCTATASCFPGSTNHLLVSQPPASSPAAPSQASSPALISSTSSFISPPQSCGLCSAQSQQLC